jgi:hypothetical protein
VYIYIGHILYIYIIAEYKMVWMKIMKRTAECHPRNLGKGNGDKADFHPILATGFHPIIGLQCVIFR